MISIATITANTAGNVIISELPDSVLDDQSARVSRVKTLDGGVVINHGGVVVGDRTLSIKCYLSDVDEAKIKTLFENEVMVMVAIKAAVYTGVIADMKHKTTTNLTIYLKERISA